MTWHAAVSTLFPLGFVLLLIGAVCLACRVVWPAMRAASPQPDMAIRCCLVLDSRRRRRLVDIRGVPALVLTGGGSDVVIPWPRE
jgi:hypothetical protein